MKCTLAAEVAHGLACCMATVVVHGRPQTGAVPSPEATSLVKLSLAVQQPGQLGRGQRVLQGPFAADSCRAAVAGMQQAAWQTLAAASRGPPRGIARPGRHSLSAACFAKAMAPRQSLHNSSAVPYFGKGRKGVTSAAVCNALRTLCQHALAPSQEGPVVLLQERGTASLPQTVA